MRSVWYYFFSFWNFTFDDLDFLSIEVSAKYLCLNGIESNYYIACQLDK